MTEDERAVMMVAFASRVNTWRNSTSPGYDADGNRIPIAAQLERLDDLVARREAALRVEWRRR